MPDWSIKIVGEPGQTATFEVDRNDVEPGDPLVAEPTDLVSWNNTTDDTHRPWPLDAKGEPIPESQVPRGSTYYLSDTIPPDSSSRPSWLVPSKAQDGSTTVQYCCLLHPQERGEIIISSA
jgi:hypothetical protein